MLTLPPIIFIEFLLGWLAASILGGFLSGASESSAPISSFGQSLKLTGTLIAASAPIVAIGASFMISKIYPLAIIVGNGDFDKYFPPTKVMMCGSVYASDIECGARNLVELAIFLPGLSPLLPNVAKAADAGVVSLINSSQAEQIKGSLVLKLY